MPREFGAGVVPFRRYGDRYLNYEQLAGDPGGAAAAQEATSAAVTGDGQLGGDVNGGPGAAQAIQGAPTVTAADLVDENPYDYSPAAGPTIQGGFGNTFTGGGANNTAQYQSTIGAYAPPPEEAAAPPAPAPVEELADENPYDFAPVQNNDNDNSHVSRPETRQDAYGRVYQVGSAADPYSAQRAHNQGTGFGTFFEGQQLPGVGGAALHGVATLSNRNLDNIQQNTIDGTEGYSYGEFGNQRFGTSPGLIPGTTVVSGPSELRGLGVNTTVENTAANQQALLEAAEQDTYQSASGNTYAGQVATNKRKADDDARAQGYGSAVTDSQGNAVTNIDASGNKTVVTSGGRIQQEEESVSHGGSNDDSGGGGGK